MESGKAYAASLAKKAPPPDELEAMGGDDMGPVETDEDGDNAALESAFDDFTNASKPRESRIAALKDLIRYCK